MGEGHLGAARERSCGRRERKVCAQGEAGFSEGAGSSCRAHEPFTALYRSDSWAMSMCNRNASRFRPWLAASAVSSYTGARRAMSSSAKAEEQDSNSQAVEAADSDPSSSFPQDEASSSSARTLDSIAPPSTSASSRAASPAQESIRLFLMLITNGLPAETASSTKEVAREQRRQLASQPSSPGELTSKAGTRDRRAAVDDGSIAAAFRMYKREVYVRSQKKGAASTRSLARLDLAVRNARMLLSQRIDDPANAKELGKLPSHYLKLTRASERALREAPRQGRPSKIDDGSIAAAHRAYLRERARKVRMQALGFSRAKLAQAEDVVQRSWEIYQERRADSAKVEEQERQRASKRPAVKKLISRKSRPDDGGIAAARRLRDNASDRLRRARRRGASAEELAPLELAYQTSKEVYEQRSGDPRNAEEAVKSRAQYADKPVASRKSDDGSIAAAIRLLDRERKTRLRMRASADEAGLAQLDAAVRKGRELVDSRFSDPTNAAERASLPASYLKVYGKPQGSIPSQAQRSRPLIASAWIADADDGKPYPIWRSTGDDCSIVAARNLRGRAQRARRKAREACASAEVLEALESALQASKELYKQRFCERRNEEEADAIRARKSAQRQHDTAAGGRGKAPLPDDGDVQSALRSYNRAVTLRRKLRKREASEEELTAADAAVQEMGKVLRLRRAEPEKRRTLRGPPPAPDDGSVQAAFRLRRNASVRLGNARGIGAMPEAIAELDSALQASKALHKQRLLVARTAEKANAAQAPASAPQATSKIVTDRVSAKGTAPMPDDGSIAAARRAYARARARKLRLQTTGASKRILAQAELALRQSLEAWRLRRAEPANAEEQEELSASKRIAGESHSTRGRKPEPDDGSIAAARRAYERELYHRRTRKSNANMEELAQMDMAVRRSKQAIMERAQDPSNAKELGTLPSGYVRVGLQSGQPAAPDDGSIQSAHRIYKRESKRRWIMRRSEASEENLARADAAVRESREVAYLRYTDPANAQERKQLPASYAVHEYKPNDSATPSKS